MLDFKDHTVETLINIPSIRNGLRIVSADMAFADAVGILKQPQTKVVVGVDAASGAPTGVIIRAHRRY